MLISKLSEALAGICGSGYVSSSAEALFPYTMDQTLDLRFSFDILV
jgi:hypothetical protein